MDQFEIYAPNIQDNQIALKLLLSVGGYKNCGEALLTGEYSYIRVYIPTKTLGGNNTQRTDNVRFTLPDDWKEFIQFFHKPNIKIGDNAVVFESDGIKVGCQFITKDTILKIAKEFS